MRTVARVREKIIGFGISKLLAMSIVASAFWYLSLFPGRFGSDPDIAVRLMQKGQSTDWWTALYFWQLKLATFNGTSIWFATLLSISVLYLTLVYFIRSLPEDKKTLDRTILIITISPLFGNFAVNLNHDTYFTSGIFLALGYIYRTEIKLHSISREKYTPYLIALCLLNSRTGYFVLAAFLFYLLLHNHKFLKAIKLATFSMLVFLLSTLGITKTEIPLHLLPALADIKCVVQHPEARVSEEEWAYLTQFWSRSNWTNPTTCSSVDIELANFPNSNLVNIHLEELARTYLTIAFHNPAIVIEAHLQRASIALPPPFFQGPKNQVSMNISDPIGYGTNTALQDGPIVLHPSVDNPEFKAKIGFLKPLEAFALFGSFLINQASWFWGWGGLWLWPILAYVIIRFKSFSLKQIIRLTFPIIVTHSLLIAVCPIPAPRYVMSTILVGNIFLVLLASSTLKKLKH